MNELPWLFVYLRFRFQRPTFELVIPVKAGIWGLDLFFGNSHTSTRFAHFFRWEQTFRCSRVKDVNEAVVCATRERFDLRPGVLGSHDCRAFGGNRGLAGDTRKLPTIERKQRVQSWLPKMSNLQVPAKAGLVRLKAHLVREVEVLFRYALSGL